ncbi:MAG: alpha/beta fold hydrolase [Actinomycetales bacterium]|nr:alpha/beta fold hydrolase [Actinomycetales bacterium]
MSLRRPLRTVLAPLLALVVGLLLLGVRPAAADALIVSADGQRQWISCAGEGGPTAVLINGLGSSHTIWSPVLKRLESRTRVCVTDRPGLGSSPPRVGSRRTDAGEHARELSAALVAAGEKGPYLLIAHSYGGLIGRAFAAQRPGEVAGLMLVDAVYPGIQRTFLPSYRGDWHEGGTVIDMDASERATRGGPDLGSTPLVVLTAGKPGNGSSWADRKWNREQRKAASLSDVSVHWFARKSGHVIQHDQPGRVVAALDWLLAHQPTS